MPRDGTATRKKILDAAFALVLDHGFGATSVDRVIDKAGITKGTFFYHFPTKLDLAHALVERFIQQEETLTAEIIGKAERLARDPVGKLLIAIGLFIEMLDGMTEPLPGCLLASFCYQSGLVDDHTRGLIRDSFLHTRAAIRELLEEAAKAQPPRVDVDFDALADMFTGVFEGGFIFERSLGTAGATAAQLRQYRTYLELLFAK